MHLPILHSGRRLAAGTAALVLAGSGLAVASASGPAADLGADTPSNALVRVVPNAPECPGDFSKVTMPLDPAGFGCVHNVSDGFDARAQAYARSRGIRPASAKVRCYGDGTTGPRIQFVYGYIAGQPNRSRTVLSQIRTQMAPRMQAVINAQSDGKDLGLRFAMTRGCKSIDVKVIRFSSKVQSRTGHSGETLGKIANTMRAMGYNRDDRKYLVMWDGWARSACGVGYAAVGSPITSLPYSPFAYGVPTLGARTDPGKVARLGSTQHSMVFNHVGSPRGRTCFNTQGISTVVPQLHELFHTLGAVQFDAPNGNDTGHCDDAPSIMCPGGGPGYGAGVSNPSCRKVVVETLDCGRDDYWNPNPPADSYLFTHLNVAKSQFFGPQPQDNLKAAPA